MSEKQQTLQQQLGVNRKLMGETLWNMMLKGEQEFGIKKTHTRKILSNPPKRIKRVIHGKRWSLQRICDLVLETNEILATLRKIKSKRRGSWRSSRRNMPRYEFFCRYDNFVSARELNSSDRKCLNAPFVFDYTRPLRDRMDDRIRAKLKRIFHRDYRINDHGNDNFHLPRNGTVANVLVTNFDDWDYYPSHVKRSKLRTDLDFTVPPGWWINVYQQGLHRVDNMLTLSAKKILEEVIERHPSGPKTVELFEATWVVQKAGYKIKAHKGYIARCKGEEKVFHYHYRAKSIDDIRIWSKDRKSVSAYRPINSVWDKLWKEEVGNEDPAHCDVIKISRQIWMSLIAKRQEPRKVLELLNFQCKVWDARRLGNCLPGIENFCNQHDLPFEQKEAPFLDVFDIYVDPDQKMGWDTRSTLEKVLMYSLKRNLKKVAKKKLVHLLQKYLNAEFADLGLDGSLTNKYWRSNNNWASLGVVR